MYPVIIATLPILVSQAIPLPAYTLLETWLCEELLA